MKCDRCDKITEDGVMFAVMITPVKIEGDKPAEYEHLGQDEIWLCRHCIGKVKEESKDDE